MNKKHYNNVISWTLKHERTTQTGDELATVRAIFKNMGVALPNGGMQEVYKILKTNQYMSWRACSMQEAQQAADNGTAALGISENKIVIISPNDEECTTHTISTKPIMRTNDVAFPTDMLFFYYTSGTTCFKCVQAVYTIEDCIVRLDTKLDNTTNDTRMRDSEGNVVVLSAEKKETVPLLNAEEIETVNSGNWYQILYKGMVAYVPVNCFSRTSMVEPEFKEVRLAEVNGGNTPYLNVRSTPYTNDGNNNLLGRFSNMTVVKVMSGTAQKDGWYPVYGQLSTGDYTYGWCYGYYLDTYVDLYAHRLNQNQIASVLNNITNCSTNIIPASRKVATKAIANTLLNRGYAPALVAGVMGNIVAEGDVGQFESAAYTSNSKPEYLVYMDTNYNGLNFYSNNYSGKKIMEVSVSDVYTILENLHNQSNGTWYINGSLVGFGIGCIQWSFSRAYSLVKFYVQVANGSDTINEQQAAMAEAMMIQQEFEQSYYRQYIKNWATDMNSINAMNTITAAEAAGRCLCNYYVQPYDPNGSQANTRATRSAQIFDAVMGSVI